MSETSHSWYYRENDTLVLRVRAHPRASHEASGEVLDNTIKIHTTAPPVDGAANAKLIAFLARQFGTAKRDIELRRGEKGRTKTFRIGSPGKLPPAVDLLSR